MSDPTRTLLARMRFIEWLAARRDLSDLQRRVAVRLISLYSPARGYAWPSQESLAADLGVDRRSIIRAIDALVRGGLFTRKPGGGRGRATEYTPCLDAVPEGCPFAAERERGGEPKGGAPKQGPQRPCFPEETVTGDDTKQGPQSHPIRKNRPESRLGITRKQGRGSHSGSGDPPETRVPAAGASLVVVGDDHGVAPHEFTPAEWRSLPRARQRMIARLQGFWLQAFGYGIARERWSGLSKADWQDLADSSDPIKDALDLLADSEEREILAEGAWSADHGQLRM